ncbi:polysaccharide deacetylase [Kribbella kalugense]|uniref:polysaccharide deacetylase n=1 Tax=Kribbella kalugense TaxID=2512221 RepID=UPI0010651EE2|nr:polysaccharide deacetylase [Kribbella kalugense]
MGAALVVAAVLAGCADVPLEGAPSPSTSPSHKPKPSATPKPSPTPSSTPSATPTVTPTSKLPAAAPVLRAFPGRLPNGKPPLFVVVSFDGAGDLALWARWRAVAKQVNARMTFFLSGPYLYPGDHRSDYKPPYRKPGASEIGWGDPANVLGRTKVLREAIAEGHEIGTHANGHFCGANGIGRWTTAQWTAELTAFDRMVRTGPSLAAGKAVQPPFDPATVKGMRTPCLEGNRPAYRQAMVQRGMLYDASAPGYITWPKKQDGLWNFPLESVTLAGTSKKTLTMDYNLWFSQTQAHTAPVAQAPALKAQVLATYQQALAKSRASGNPPLFLGNHFNRWNNSVYSDALTDFVKQTCTQPDVRCVSNMELASWLAKYGVPSGQNRPS